MSGLVGRFGLLPAFSGNITLDAVSVTGLVITPSASPSHPGNPIKEGEVRDIRFGFARDLGVLRFGVHSK